MGPEQVARVWLGGLVIIFASAFVFTLIRNHLLERRPIRERKAHSRRVFYDQLAAHAIARKYGRKQAFEIGQLIDQIADEGDMEQIMENTKTILKEREAA